MRYIKLILAAIIVINLSSISSFAFQGEEVVTSVLEKYNKQQPNMSAKDYNSVGMSFYKKKQFDEAALIFYAATELDNKHMLANYNLACVLSLKLTEELKYDVLKPLQSYDRIFYYLYVSMQNEKRMKKAQVDADLVDIKGYNEMLFEAITIPEFQRVNFSNILTFVNAYRVEDQVSIVFTDPKGEKQIFTSDDEKLSTFNFYVTDDAMPPVVSSNKALVGKKYNVMMMYYPKVNDNVSYGSITIAEKVVSIEEMKE